MTAIEARRMMGSGRAYTGRNSAQGHPTVYVGVEGGGGLLTCLADAEKARLWMREAMNMIAVGADEGADLWRRESQTTSGGIADVEGGDVGDGGRAKKKKMRCRPVDQENSIRWSRAWLKCLTRQNCAGPVRPSASRRLAGKRGAGMYRKGRGRIILSGLSGSAKGPLFLADDSDDVNSLHQHRSQQGWLVAGRVASYPASS